MGEVRVQIEEVEPERPSVGRRLRRLALGAASSAWAAAAGAYAPFVQHFSLSHRRTVLWLNSNGTPNEDAPSVDSVRVTIGGQLDNTITVNLGVHGDNAEEENVPLLPTTQATEPNVNHLIDIDPNLVRNDEDNNNQNNRVVDVNFNDNIPIVIMNCLIFALLLTVIFLYDHLEGVITLIYTQMLFNCLREEQINFRNKNILRFLINTSLITKSLEYIYLYDGIPLMFVVYNPTFNFPANIWDVLWIVYMNDCALQSITFLLKVLVKYFTLKFMSIRTKLKIYSFLESISQLYRSIIPIQPWTCYFYELAKASSFPQFSFIIGVILSVAYIILKCLDVVRKLSYMKSTMQRIFKRSTTINLNKEILASKELKCSICLEDFSFPLQLSCHHIFCSTCITQWSGKSKTCPLCRTPMNEDFISEDISSPLFLQLF